jgi:hypothetical protein
VPDPVEVDTGDRGLLAPAGDLAVDAVEQQVKLDQQGAEQRAAEPGDEQGRAGQHARDDHQMGELIRRDPGVHQVPGPAQRDLPHVQTPGPVFSAAPVLETLRVNDRTEFSY